MPRGRADLSGSSVGRFQIVSLLGAGGMGEVYRAEDPKLKRPVALKRMALALRNDERYRQRFLREAARACAVDHPNIARIYDVFEHEGELFLVMEYVEGATLRRRMQEQRLSTEQFLEFATQCTEALVAAHAVGVIHCDLKPENIMLTHAGTAKVLDFGVAKRLPVETDGSAVTQSMDTRPGAIGGTLPYAAPEVLLDKPPDARSDIFSMGVVFYETLTGKHPFLAPSKIATADKILHENPRPVSSTQPNLPLGLDQVVSRALAKNPAERYQRAQDLAEDLKRLRREPTASLAAPSVRQRPRFVRTATLVAVIAAIVVAAVLARFLLTARHGDDRLPSQKHLAVLPFRAVGQGSADQAYAQGLTETLTAKLAQLTVAENLHVTPVSESRRMSSIAQARRELGVNLVVEGSVRRAGDAVRVSYELIDAAQQRHFRGDTITASAADPFGLEDLVVESVLRSVEIEVALDKRRAVSAPQTQIADAYGFYLRGRGFLQDDAFNAAITAFTRAVELDGRFAPAHAALGEAYWRKYEDTKERRWVDRAQQSCEQARQLDAKLPAARICLGTLSQGTGRHELAAAEFQRALEVDAASETAYRGLADAYSRLRRPREAEQTYLKAIAVRPHYWAGYYWLGAFYAEQARYPEAAQQFHRAIELFPENARLYTGLGAVHLYVGKYGEAIEVLRRSIELHPTFGAYSNLGTAYMRLRKFSEAVQAYEKASELSAKDYRAAGNLASAYYWVPGMRDKSRAAYERAITLAEDELRVNPNQPGPYIRLGEFHAALGQRDAAHRYLQRALRISPRDPDLLWHAAQAHALLGERDQAVRFLQKAVAHGLAPAEITGSAVFDGLRDHPRFGTLIGSQ